MLAKNVPFLWTPECEEAFLKLKNALITAPVLVLPRSDKPYILTTDAGTAGLAYILSQKDSEGREHVICYGVRGLRAGEKHYTITELEALAVIEGIKLYHPYLIHNTFEVITDHVPLTYLQTMHLIGNGRLTRWALFLQPYKFTVRYLKGELLTAADALSRIPRKPKINDGGENIKIKEPNEPDMKQTSQVNQVIAKAKVNIEFIFENNEPLIHALSIQE